MDNTLYSHYEEKVRPCIDLIDSLRALGVDQDLSLPTIAVIGDQSSGKSSVLEALSGVALPRGSGIVTRCPLELKLKKGKEIEWNGRISYKNYMKELKEPCEVEAEVIKAQNTMAGKDLGISSELISLEIESKSSPDLTIIDLPGIARVAVGNQPTDIGDQIKNLITSYIKKQETINLVVIPCNVDIATTEALKMAQEADPTGERTLGVLTKPDLIDRGTEDSVLNVLRNESFSLKKGYMIVKCRGQQDINEKMTLPEALRKEWQFFNGNEHFKMLLEERLATVHCLAGRLTAELVNQIKRTLPALLNQVRMKLEETTKELECLGIGVPEDDSEKMCYIVEKIQDYCGDLSSVTWGEYNKEFQDELKLYTIVREGFGVWHQHIIKQKCAFENEVNTEVKQYIEKSRGRELPGFTNYRIFESLAKRKILDLEETAAKMVKEISDMVQTVFSRLAELHLSGTPNLLREAKSKIDDIRQVQENEAFHMVRALFKMEEMVYSQDGIYICNLQEAYSKTKYDEEIKNMRPRLPRLNTDTEAMVIHLNVYYKIASNRLDDLIPLVIRFNLLQEAASKIHREMLHLIKDKHVIEELLQEDEDVAEKRKFLCNRKDRLNKARQVLVRY